MDNVRAAAETLGQAITNPAVRAAWFAYVAAQSERDARQDTTIADLKGSLASLRRDLDAAIDGAVKRALESTELRVHGLGALIDAMNAFESRLDAIETRGDVRTAMLQTVIGQLERLSPSPPKPVPIDDDIDDPTGTDAGAHPYG